MTTTMGRTLFLRRMAIPSISPISSIPIITSTPQKASTRTSVATTKNEAIYLNHHQQLLSSRQYHRGRNSKHSKKKQPCPYRALQIPEGSTYAAAKKSFLRIAMAHHPDTIGDDEEEKKQQSIELFVSARTAFERLAACPEGLAVLREDLENLKAEEEMSDEEFDAWFLKETGHSNPFQFDLDPATMREVADMHDEVSHGLDRDGGMWHLASLVSKSVKEGKGGGNNGAGAILRLEAGDVDGDDPPVGSLTRRRKRKSRVF
uniref:J domain-containing protein n=1 Tax=Ditylum brightwellii TaxID=49249 RepID=A0A6V2PPL9_9STRA